MDVHGQEEEREREKKREIRERIFGYSHDGDVYWLSSRNIIRRKRISMSGRGTRNRTSDSLFPDNSGTLAFCGTLLPICPRDSNGDIALLRNKNLEGNHPPWPTRDFLSFQRFPSFSPSVRGKKGNNNGHDVSRHLLTIVSSVIPVTRLLLQPLFS